MILLLASWCAGLVVGQVALPQAAASAALFAAGPVVGTGLLLISAGRARRAHLVPLLAAAALLLGLWRGAATLRVPGPGTVDHYLGRHVTLDGTVARASGSAGLQSFWLGDIRLGGGRLSGLAQVTVRSAGQLVPGSQVRVTGTVERLPGRGVDGSTGYDDRMEREGVLAAIPAAGVRPIAPAPPLSVPALTWRLRASMAAAVRAAVPEPEATILLGELVGIRGKLPLGTETDLVSSGLVHLLAVSGLKVALVGGLLAALLRRAGRPAALLAIAAVFAYALVGGASSAALRSAVMGSLALVAQVVRRDVDPPRNLLLAASALLGLHPSLVADLSFQYSFLGVAGIQLLNRPIDRHLGVIPRPFREALSVSLAAQLATVPLTAAYFHVVPLCGPLANTLALPFLPISMGLAAWVAAALPGASGLPADAATGCAHALLLLAGAASRAPGGVLPVPWFGLPHALAYYAGALVLVATSRLQLSMMRAGAAALSAVIAVLAWSMRPDGRLHLAVLDTPGGGILVTAPDGARMLVDAGASASALRAALDAQLAPPRLTLDAVLLSGSAPATAGGVGGLGPRVPALYVVPARAAGDVPALVGAALAARGAVVREVSPGDDFGWHGLEIAVGPCGPGISVTLVFHAVGAWVCDQGTAAEPGALPPGRLELADVGDGRLTPDGDLGRVTWVVVHGTGGRGGIDRTTVGPHLWRSARDGPLLLTCDAQSCSR